MKRMGFTGCNVMTEPTTAEIQEQFNTWHKGMYHPIQYDHGRHGAAIKHVEILLDRLKVAEDKLIDVAERLKAILKAP